MIEALFVLIPVAPGLKDESKSREEYLDQIIDRIEEATDDNIRDHIAVSKSYAHEEFISDFNYNNSAEACTACSEECKKIEKRINKRKLSEINNKEVPHILKLFNF